MNEDNRKINVLLMNDHLGWHGKIMHGVGKLFLQWVSHFDRTKYNIVVCILREKNELSKYFEDTDVKIIFLNKKKYNPWTLIELLRIIRQERIDVLHVQGYGATNFGRIARLLTGLPVMVHFHDTSQYYPWIQRIADWLLGRYTSAAIAVSHATKRFWIEQGRVPGLPLERFMVMHNCVPVENFASLASTDTKAAKAALGIEPEAHVVGTVTRLYERKGNRYLLDAAVEVLNLLPQTQFVIVGDGPMRAELEAYARQVGVHHRVHFAGYQTDVARWLAAFDIKVFTSYDEGGSPLVVLEAMAMGKPIVSTDILEILEDEKTALLVPSRDARALAEKVTTLLLDPSLAQTLGEKARSVSQLYDVHRYVRKLEEMYRNLSLHKTVENDTKSVISKSLV